MCVGIYITHDFFKREINKASSAHDLPKEVDIRCYQIRYAYGLREKKEKTHYI